jgi:hypothetical protein
MRQAEAARVAEESSAVRMDHDDPHAPSASAKASATTENPEGHSGMQYAAAAPCPLDTRSTMVPNLPPDACSVSSCVFALSFLLPAAFEACSYWLALAWPMWPGVCDSSLSLLSELMVTFLLFQHT